MDVSLCLKRKFIYREPPFPFNLFKFNKSSLPCDLELVKHAEQRKWVRRDQRANILHLLKSRALCMRTGVICVVWIATALVYYGLIIGNYIFKLPAYFNIYSNANEK